MSRSDQAALVYKYGNKKHTCLHPKITYLSSLSARTKQDLLDATCQLSKKNSLYNGLEAQLNELKQFLSLATEDVKQANDVNSNYKTVNEKLTEQVLHSHTHTHTKIQRLSDNQPYHSLVDLCMFARSLSPGNPGFQAYQIDCYSHFINN